MKLRLKLLTGAAMLTTSLFQSALAFDQSSAGVASQPPKLRLTAEEIVDSAAERNAVATSVQPPLTEAKGSYDYFAWPDTPLGVMKNADGQLVFFGSDGGFHKKYAKYAGCITRTVGTLSNPLGSKSNPPRQSFVQSDPCINPDFASYSYVGGGPVMRIPEGLPGAGKLLMVYHAERNTQGGTGFYSNLGIAKSSDDGFTWQDCGEIIEPNHKYNPQDQSFEIGDGHLVIDPTRNYLMIHFPDWLPGNNNYTIASVARVPLVAYLKSIFESCSGKAYPFAKYYNGKWSQPGINGLSTNIISGPWGGATQVRYNSYIHQYVAILDDTQNISYAVSPDGVNWSQTVLIKSGASQLYATPIGAETLPNVLGKSFYIYYTSDANGWQTATVHRLSVSF